jgi:hypothetical protein
MRRNKILILIFVAILGITISVPIINHQAKNAFLIPSSLPTPTPPHSKFDKIRADNLTDNGVHDSSNATYYTAALQYNPKTKKVLQLSTGLIKADLLYYKHVKPSPSPNEFTYKFTVFSNHGSLLQEGWVSSPVNTVKAKNNTYKFEIGSMYQKNALVNVYIDTTLIWVGVMP